LNDSANGKTSKLVIYKLQIKGKGQTNKAILLVGNKKFLHTAYLTPHNPIYMPEKGYKMHIYSIYYPATKP
jgi:hypothetical protein